MLRPLNTQSPLIDVGFLHETGAGAACFIEVLEGNDGLQKRSPLFCRYSSMRLAALHLLVLGAVLTVFTQERADYPGMLFVLRRAPVGSSQAKTESCSVLWSRFLETLIVEQLVEVPTCSKTEYSSGLSNRSLKPSVAGCGRTRRGLHCFLPGQRSTAFAEQIFSTPAFSPTEVFPPWQAFGNLDIISSCPCMWLSLVQCTSLPRELQKNLSLLKDDRLEKFPESSAMLGSTVDTCSCVGPTMIFGHPSFEMSRSFLNQVLANFDLLRNWKVTKVYL